MIEEYKEQSLFTVYPSEFEGVKPRLKVVEGDFIKRGELLFENKKNEKMQFRSPCCGTIKEILLGDRRAPIAIKIDPAKSEESITFKQYTIDRIDALSCDEVKEHLLNTGLWPLLKQRPFSKIADPDTEPKAIFINAARSAPFQADFALILKGDEAAFQAGITALSKLTKGAVHLCSSEGDALPEFKQATSHTFSGPHPSGTTSVHINRISPILPHDTVYTIPAQDLILIGKLLLTGELPRTKIIAFSGPHIRPEFLKHYRVDLGADLTPLFQQALNNEQETRLIAGTLLAGQIVRPDSSVRFYGSEYFAMKDDEDRFLLGWTLPGLFQYSVHRLNLSSFLPRSKRWDLGTNLHGANRSMVVTGWYDRYQPLNIMTDVLIRAVLAHDTDEAIQLGILETDPEDFALAAFIDPAKTDLCGIIKQGLEEIEEEGI